MSTNPLELAHGKVHQQRIFGKSPSRPELWNINEIWVYQLTVIFKSKEIYSLGLISREQLILMPPEGIQKSMQDPGFSLVMKARGKVDLKVQKKEKDSKLKSLERFCRFLRSVDESCTSTPDRFLIPFSKDEIDWESIGAPFRGIPTSENDNEMTTLEKIYQGYGGKRLRSLIVPFETDTFFPSGSTNGKLRHPSWLTFDFWDVSDRITSTLKDVLTINCKTNLEKSPSSIEKLDKPHEEKRFEQLGRNFIRMLISFSQFFSGNDVEKLTKERSDAWRKTNSIKIQDILIQGQLIRPQHTSINYLVGAWYFHENMHYFYHNTDSFYKNMTSTVRLAEHIGLSKMMTWNENTWITYNQRVPSSDAIALEDKLQDTIIKYKFKNINLLRMALRQYPDLEFRRIEWLGDAVLADWSSLMIEKIQHETPKKVQLHEAFVYLNSNDTLLKWATRRLDSTGGKTPAFKMVEAIIGVVYIDCQCQADGHAESSFHCVLLGMFEEELQTVKDMYCEKEAL